MLVSRCHKDTVKVVHGCEGTSYWICSHCGQPTDPFTPLEMTHNDVDDLAGLAVAPAG